MYDSNQQWRECKWQSCLFQFEASMVDTLYTYAKFQYECGNYSGAAEYLYFVRVLVSVQYQNIYTLSGSW
jgi:translation initiation factor 3 subunit E